MNAIELTKKSLNTLNKQNDFPLILTRMTVGLMFFESGIQKLFIHPFQNLVDYFITLGIPLPFLNALIAASIELIGGACLVLGLLTRFFSFQLAFVMVVAIATAQWSKVHGVSEFLYLPETLLIVLCIWIILKGPGRISIDYYFARKLGLSGDVEES